jgi:NADPH-dependent ferric siderophore reductase
MLKSRCDVRLDEPRLVLDRLCAHYAEHGAVEQTDDEGRIRIAYGDAVLSVSDGRLRMEVEASDETNLAYVKMGLVHHLRAFAKRETPAVRWSGDGAVGVRPPFFREMTVVKAFDITPSMRRVVLRGHDLDRFAVGGLHVRLVFPPRGRAPIWPVLGEDGCPAWPGGEDALTARVYTIRHLDLEEGEVSVDILRHDGDATPGSHFAVNACPGDVVGMTGPGGGGIPEARSIVLLGDETAIPAIARILGALEPGVRARAYIEVAGPGEEQSLPCAVGTHVEWLHRGRGSASLADVARKLTPETLGDDTFVWAGCEFADFKAIRRHCRDVLKHPRERHLVVAYWRKGAEGDEARAA